MHRTPYRKHFHECTLPAAESVVGKAELYHAEEGESHEQWENAHHGL
jgi:hypothetical protein